MTKNIYIHPTSCVSQKARIGAGTKIWQFCTILDDARIGKNCLLAQNVYVESRVRIGNRVKIKNNVCIFDCVTMEDDVFIGSGTAFTNVLNPRSFISRKSEYRPIRIKKGATIGANATLIAGITIGRYAFIGAGAVVTRSIPDYAMVFGIPARQHGWICECGIKLKSTGKTVCSSCRKVYVITASRCKPVQ